MALLEIVGVRKAYRRGALWGSSTRSVLEGVNLSVEPGESVALVGPNGCGKTTLLKVISGLISADEGSSSLCGEPVEGIASRKRIGLCTGDDRSLYHRLTLRQNLEFQGALYGIEAGALADEIDALAGLLDLRPILPERVDRCSSGMRARANCARALLTRPALLLMDEPTKSLDSDHAQCLWRVIRARRDAGLAVVFSTHSAEEASQWADRTVTLKAGKLEPHAEGAA